MSFHHCPKPVKESIEMQHLPFKHNFVFPFTSCIIEDLLFCYFSRNVRAAIRWASIGHTSIEN